MSRRQAGVRQEGVLVSEEAPLGPPSYGVKSECCQKGEPLLRPKSGILFNTWKWIVQGDRQSKRLYWEGCTGGEQQGKGNRENCSATWLTVSGFMVMGLVSRLSLANHSDSGSFLVALAWLNQDGFQHEGFWEIGRMYGLLLPPSGRSKFSRLVFGGRTAFFIGTSCCETTQISGYYHS